MGTKMKGWRIRGVKKERLAGFFNRGEGMLGEEVHVKAVSKDEAEVTGRGRRETRLRNSRHLSCL